MSFVEWHSVASSGQRAAATARRTGPYARRAGFPRWRWCLFICGRPMGTRAPVPVTAFIATASKGGVVAALLRFFVAIDGFRSEPLQTVMIASNT